MRPTWRSICFRIRVVWIISVIQCYILWKLWNKKFLLRGTEPIAKDKLGYFCNFVMIPVIHVQQNQIVSWFLSITGIVKDNIIGIHENQLLSIPQGAKHKYMESRRNLDKIIINLNLFPATMYFTNKISS